MFRPGYDLVITSDNDPMEKGELVARVRRIFATAFSPTRYFRDGHSPYVGRVTTNETGKR